MTLLKYNVRANYGGAGTYENRSHLLKHGEKPITSKLGKSQSLSPLPAIGIGEEMVYTGSIPSIVGLVAMIVRLNQTETIVYTRGDIVAKIMAKYGQRFKKTIGVVQTDPYEKTQHLRRREPIVFEEDEEGEYDFLRSAGYDAKEEAAIGKYQSANEQQSEEDDSEVKSGISIDSVKNGLNLLTRKELEVFSLWTLNCSDSEILKSLGIKFESISIYKTRIFKKLRDYFKANTIARFGSIAFAFNKVEPLYDLIEDRLQLHGQTDPELSALSHEEKEVFHYWKKMESTNALMGVINLSRQRIDAIKESLFAKLGRGLGATCKQDFIERARIMESENTSLDNEDFRVERDIDFDSLLLGLRSLRGKDLEIFECMCSGMAINEIATQTQVTVRSIHGYKRKIFEKVAHFYKTDNLKTFEKRIVDMRSVVAEKLASQRDRRIDWNSLITDLTDEERSLLTLWRQGKILKDISEEMGIYPARVQMLQVSIIEKTSKFHEFTTREEFEVLFEFKDCADRIDNNTEIIGHQIQYDPAPAFQETESESEVLPAPEKAPVLEVEEIRPVTFNDFIQAYGNRKDIIKALEQFKRIPENEGHAILSDIARSKAANSNFTYLKSPHAYLLGASWRTLKL